MTNIEWTNETWNPIVGCTKASEGCRNCYAEIMGNRLAGMERERFKNFSNEGDKLFDWKYANVIKDGKWNGKTHFVESALQKPLKWKKPRIVFVCSMGDLFHESIPFGLIDDVFSITQKCPQHTFQVLTKRPEIIKEYFASRNITKPYTNVWLGVTAENQEQANKRIPVLLQIPAAVRFISVEPMLSEVTLLNWMRYINCIYHNVDYPTTTNKIDWIICGGESGHKARPMHPDWARSLRNQCQEANVPFFFKQWGEWMSIAEMTENQLDNLNLDLLHDQNRVDIEFDPYISLCKIGKKKAGRLLDGKEHNQFPTNNNQL